MIWASQDKNFILYVLKKKILKNVQYIKFYALMSYANFTDISLYKQSRIMIATAMFHAKWLLSCDV